MNKSQQEVIDTLIREFEDKESLVQSRGGFEGDEMSVSRYAAMALIILAVNYNLHLGKVWRKMGKNITQLAKLYGMRRQVESLDKGTK